METVLTIGLIGLCFCGMVHSPQEPPALVAHGCAGMACLSAILRAHQSERFARRSERPILGGPQRYAFVAASVAIASVAIAHDARVWLRLRVRLCALVMVLLCAGM